VQTIYLESVDENVKPDTTKPYEKVVVRKPHPPKIAKVKRFKQIGRRSWVTIYRVRDGLSNIIYGDPILKKAIAYAKNLSIKKIEEYRVSVDKVLIGGDQTVAIITPGKFKTGKFRFNIIDPQ
jgi:hypothetical protein